MEINQIYTSFIHWFGSGQKNYGWIVRPEDIENLHNISNYKNGYYFHKNNILDHELLEYLQQDDKLFGQGVYIKFQLWRKNGKSEAINVKLWKDVGIIDKIGGYYSFDSRIKCEDSSLIYFRNDNFQLDDIVSFGLRRTNNRNNKCEPLLINKIEDENIICDYLTSSNPTIFIKSLISNINLNRLSLEEIESKITGKKQLLKESSSKVIKELIQKIPSISIKYYELRSFLSTSEYFQLVNQYINSLDQESKNEIVQELILQIKSTNSSQQIIDYWKNIKYFQEKLEYKRYLWEIAPEEYKLIKIKEKYQKFFNIVRQFAESGYPNEDKIYGNLQELYCLNQNEQELIKKWTDKNLDDDNNYNEFLKMVSARGAEKLVAKYYKSIGYQVEDTSIQQIEYPYSGNWEKYDIAITKGNKVIYLDVKNARCSRHSKVYSDFCVRKLKESRQQNIKIIGVLSPLISTDREDRLNTGINNIEYLKKEIAHISEPIKILGSFDKSEINELENLFKDDQLESINISEGNPTYYPHWLFDYDDEFYIEQIKVINKFRELTGEEIPSYQEFHLIEKQYNALPLFLAAQRELPNEWKEKLPTWQCCFIDSITKLNLKSRIKLPHIFLAILKHFIKMLISNNNDKDYNPEEYLKILYTSRDFYQDAHPLKIYDPVKDQVPNDTKEFSTIINFCKTLNILYSRRENLKLNEFVRFHFRGKGLLQGKKQKPNDQKTTILAYCQCGYRPLIRSEEPQKINICDTCYRLICPKCKLCKIGCRSYIARTQKHPVLGLNIVNLIGNVGGDPDIRYFNDGTIRCNLSLAVNRRHRNNDQPDWFDLKLWGQTAEMARDYVRRGTRIGIKGALIFDTWIDTQTEAYRSKPVIQVKQLYLLDEQLNQQNYLNDS